MDSGTKKKRPSQTRTCNQDPTLTQRVKHNADVMPLHEGWLLSQLLFTYKCSGKWSKVQFNKTTRPLSRKKEVIT